MFFSTKARLLQKLMFKRKFCSAGHIFDGTGCNCVCLDIYFFLFLLLFFMLGVFGLVDRKTRKITIVGYWRGE